MLGTEPSWYTITAWSVIFCKGLIFIVQQERRDDIKDEVFTMEEPLTVMIMATMLLVKTKDFLTFFTADKDLFPEWSVNEGHSRDQNDGQNQEHKSKK